MDKKIYIETYGCQMNVVDSEVIFSIMRKEGYERTTSMDDADIILANTCSVRDKRAGPKPLSGLWVVWLRG